MARRSNLSKDIAEMTAGGTRRRRPERNERGELMAPMEVAERRVEPYPQEEVEIDPRTLGKIELEPGLWITSEVYERDFEKARERYPNMTEEQFIRQMIKDINQGKIPSS